MTFLASVECLKNNRYNLCIKSQKYKSRETVQCLMFAVFLALNMCITFSQGFNGLMNILLMGTSAGLVLILISNIESHFSNITQCMHRALKSVCR